VPGVIRKLWRIAAGLFAGAVILAALLVGGLRLALVQAPEYREQVEARVSEALGRPVELGSMDARLGLRGPELSFTDAQVMSRDGERRVLAASGGALQFDPWSLLQGELSPASVRLRGVRLRVERDAQGDWRLLGSEALHEPRARDTSWPVIAELPAGRLELQDLEIELDDRQRDLGPWLMQVDQLDLEIDGAQLNLSADGRLPEALGGGFALSASVSSQDARGRPSDWHVGLSVDRLDLAAARELAGRHAAVPSGGAVDGSFSASADSDGLARVAGELSATSLRLPVPATVAADAPAQADYEQLGASFEWRRGAFGWELELAGLTVERGDRNWQSERVALAFEEASSGAEGRAGRYRLSADRLRLEDLVPAAHWLPEKARSRVLALAPRGMLLQLETHVGWPLADARAPGFRIATRFEDLALAPLRPMPGLSGLSGNLAGDSDAGSAQLRGSGARVELPWLFRDAIALREAALELEWSRDPESLRLRVARLEAANQDAAVSASGQLEIPGDGASPRIDLEAVARDVQLAAAPRYLPVAIMPERVVTWLDSALLAGRVAEARAVFRGATQDFPFRDDEGLFKVEFDIADGQLDFRPGWPSADALAASVRFENEGLWAEVQEARLLEVKAGPASVAIPDLRQGRLSIEGEARGELGEFRRFALASDFLERILGRGLAPAEVRAGEASAEVDLLLPLRSIRDTRAVVDLQISGGTVAYGFLGEPVRDIDARINIDNAQVSAREIRASLAGEAFSADITVLEDGAIRLAGGGAIDAGGLARVLRLPIDTWARGTTDWRAQLQFPAPGSLAPLELAFSSQLEGLAIELPEPLFKSAEQARQLRVKAAFPTAGLVDAELEWDDSLRVNARIDRSGPEAVLLAVPGAVEGEPPGLAFSGAIRELDLGAWLEVEFPEKIDPSGLPAQIAGGRVLIGHLDAPWLPSDDLLLDVARQADHWQVELNAMRVEGTLEVPFALYGDEPLRARLGRLWADSGQAAAQQSSSGQPPGDRAEPASLDPARVPPLDIEIEDARYGDIRLGSVSARVLHEEDGFELIGLEGIGEGFIIQAEGSSRLSDTVDQSRLGVTIESDDVGATLEYMGFRRSMDARQASFEADVRWTGGLRSDWLAAIEGEASILIRDGTLVGVEPGAGRVFGLLSVQALPRRLALDFKDVFGEGTAFDRIRGDFRFEDGSAYTDNLVMQGPAAEMVVVGRIGLVERDYDQKVVIAADLGRTLPVAGTVVGGPAVGAALFLLSEILSKPFETQVTYHLGGSWEDPVVERLGSGAVPPPGNGGRDAREGGRP